MAMKRSEILRGALHSISEEELAETEKKADAKKKRTVSGIAAGAAMIAFAVLGVIFIPKPGDITPARTGLTDVPSRNEASGENGTSGTAGEESLPATDEGIPEGVIWGSPGTAQDAFAYPDNADKRIYSGLKNVRLGYDLRDRMSVADDGDLFAVAVMPILDWSYIYPDPWVNDKLNYYDYYLQRIASSPYYGIEKQILDNDQEFSDAARNRWSELDNEFGRDYEISRRGFLDPVFKKLAEDYVVRQKKLVDERARLFARDQAEFIQRVSSWDVRILDVLDGDAPTSLAARGWAAVALVTKEDVLKLDDNGEQVILLSVESGYRDTWVSIYPEGKAPKYDLPADSKFSEGMSRRMDAADGKIAALVFFGLKKREPDRFDEAYPDSYDAEWARALAEFGITLSQWNDNRFCESLGGDKIQEIIDRKHAVDRRDDEYDAARDRVLRDGELLDAKRIIFEDADGAASAVLFHYGWELTRSVPVLATPQRLREIAADGDVICILLPEEGDDMYLRDPDFSWIDPDDPGYSDSTVVIREW